MHYWVAAPRRQERSSPPTDTVRMAIQMTSRSPPLASRRSPPAHADADLRGALGPEISCDAVDAAGRQEQAKHRRVSSRVLSAPAPSSPPSV